MILGKLCNFNYKYKIKRICSKRNQVESIVEHFKRKTNRDEEKEKIRKRVVYQKTWNQLPRDPLCDPKLRIKNSNDRNATPIRQNPYYIVISSCRKRQNSATWMNLKQISLI